MAYEGSESARDNFGKFICQFKPESKTLIRKLERILNKLYRQNLSLLFNKTYIYIYIYIYMKKCKQIFLLLLLPSSLNYFFLNAIFCFDLQRV